MSSLEVPTEINPAHENFLNVRLAKAVIEGQFKPIELLIRNGARAGEAIKVAVREFILKQDARYLTIAHLLLEGRSWNLTDAIKGALQGGDPILALSFLPNLGNGPERFFYLCLFGDLSSHLGHPEWTEKARHFVISEYQTFEVGKTLDELLSIFDKRVFEQRMDVAPIPGSEHARNQFSEHVLRGDIDRAREVPMLPESDLSRFPERQRQLAKLDRAIEVPKEPHFADFAMLFGLAKKGRHHLLPEVLKRLPANIQDRARREIYYGSLAGGHLTAANDYIMMRRGKRVRKSIEVDVSDALRHAIRSEFAEIIENTFLRYRPETGLLMVILMEEDEWDLLWHFIQRFKYKPKPVERKIIAKLVIRRQNFDVVKKMEQLLGIKLEEAKN